MTTLYFDARWAGEFGIGRYSSEVRSRLTGPVHDLTAPEDPLSPRGLLAWERRIRAVPRLSRDSATLLSPSFTPSLTWPGPQAITVHDLIHLDVQEESSRAKQVYYRHVVLPAVRRNDVTFTVSEFSKNRIVEWSGVSPERIVVTGNAADARFTPEGPAHEPGYPYVLYVRNAKPHKNSVALVEAFAQLPDDGTKLVLSGAADAASVAAAARFGVTHRVVFAGRIPEEVLPDFYRGASAVAFPSLYEGFGIPAIEALACAVPVVAANVTSLPEICGDAAILVDPRSTDSIADGLSRALHDEAARAELAVCGPARAADFTWERIASTVAEALHR